MTFHRKDNFYRFWCNTTDDGWQYRAGCQSKVEKLLASDEVYERMYPDCVKAISGGKCRAMGMADEEMTKGATIYYVDRDDAGPGIVRRETPRSEATIKSHHSLLDFLNLTPNNSVTSVVSRPQEEVEDTDNAFDIGNAFDLGVIINQQVAELKGAR